MNSKVILYPTDIIDIFNPVGVTSESDPTSQEH